MQWRLPVRVLESRQGTISAPTDALADTQERFYQDYLGGKGTFYVFPIVLSELNEKPGSYHAPKTLCQLLTDRVGK